MKKIKVFWMGKRLRDVYPHATKWEVIKWKVQEFLKLCVRVIAWTGMSGALLYGAFMAGAYFNPKVSFAIQEKLVTVETEMQAPIMDRIAGCESDGNPKSKGSHIGANGQVRTHANANGTTDIGKYQINNEVWGKRASAQNYNLYVEKDNEAMAMWIYKNFGTEPWYSSKNCWK